MLADLPFTPNGLSAILLDCDLMSLLGHADQFLGGLGEEEVDIVATMLQSASILDAVCAKAACPGALLGALDFAKLPEEVQGDDVRAALTAAAPKMCDKNGAGTYCFVEATQDAMARQANLTSELAMCESGCYAQLGAEFIDDVAKAIALVAPNIKVDGASLCGGIPGGTQGPTTSMAPTSSPSPPTPPPTSPVELGQWIEGLLFHMDKVFLIVTNDLCSPMLLALVMGIFTGALDPLSGREDVAPEKLMEAICQKDTCTNAIIDALKWDSMPPALKNDEGLRDKIRTLVPKNICKKNANGSLCAAELIHDYWDTDWPVEVLRGLLSIESAALHSHGLDSHSRVLLCDSMTGRESME